MPSSTSPSSSRVPLLALGLLLTALAAWAGGVFYSLRLNPEVRFFTGMFRVQQAWTQRMEREKGHKIVVFGGSSAMFSIIGEQALKDHGLPVVNRGLSAGMDPQVVTLNALEGLKSGDTLVVAIEPGSLTMPVEATALSIQYSFAVGHPEWVQAPAVGVYRMPRLSALLALRPGSWHTFTLLGKLLHRQPLYRYRVADASVSGWNHTAVRLPLDGPPGHGPQLSADGRLLLAGLRDWCAQRGVKVIYSLPWAYVAAEKMESFQLSNRSFLIQVSDYLPVLKDPRLGAYAVKEDFSDTPWHLSDTGSVLRTAEFGAALKDWRIWTTKELSEWAPR